MIFFIEYVTEVFFFLQTTKNFVLIKKNIISLETLVDSLLTSIVGG